MSSKSKTTKASKTSTKLNPEQVTPVATVASPDASTSKRVQSKEQKKATRTSGLQKLSRTVPDEDGDEGDVEEDVDDGDEEEDEDEEEDVSEEGMARLMKALGENGLDDFAQAELRALAGADSDEGDADNDAENLTDDELGEEDSEEDEVAEGSDSEEEDGSEEDDNKHQGNDNAVDDHTNEDDDEKEAEEEEGDIPLDDALSVDEDAVPRQKIEIDNKVRFACSSLTVSSFG